MPPPVPVVSTSFGCTSSMICRQTRRFGSFGPSCDMCESDLKTTTFFPAMVVVQNAPRRLAWRAGHPATICFEMVA